MLNNKIINQTLENFDISTLDLIEKRQFDQFTQSVNKVEALKNIINTVGGDYSQLSEELALIAEEIEFNC